MFLQDFLKKLNPMSDKSADYITTFFNEEIFNKNDLLVKEGKTSKKSYFLETGIIRCYIIDLNGEEVTTRFYSAPDFLNDYLSFFKQEPSEENYEALTNCKVWSIDHKNVQYCFHNIPEFREWGRMLLTLNYVKMHKHMISFHKYTAQERYENLIQKHPEIIKNVPLKIIASFLGITKFSLSRIRKSIS